MTCSFICQGVNLLENFECCLVKDVSTSLVLWCSNQDLKLYKRGFVMGQQNKDAAFSKLLISPPLPQPRLLSTLLFPSPLLFASCFFPPFSVSCLRRIARCFFGIKRKKKKEGKEAIVKSLFLLLPSSSLQMNPWAVGNAKALWADG